MSYHLIKTGPIQEDRRRRHSGFLFVNSKLYL